MSFDSHVNTITAVNDSPRGNWRVVAPSEGGLWLSALPTQQLLVLAHAMRAKVAAANDFPSRQAAAAELASALRGDPVQV
jgi:hypothetical protein